MAVTIRDIMELDICRRLKLIGGAGGLDKEVRWPFIKNMDTISEWTHGGELVFVIGAKEDISENGLLTLMKEALEGKMSGVVMLYGEDYIRTIPKSIKKFADDNSIPLFKMPFMLKLIDITQEISKFIYLDRQKDIESTHISDNILTQLLQKNKSKEELLSYCWMKLQPLLEADRVLKSDYVKTLRSYINCNNDLLHTSQILYIHRNTMINRMKKINQLLNMSINKVEVRNELYNIFKVLEFYGQIDESTKGD